MPPPHGSPSTLSPGSQRGSFHNCRSDPMAFPLPTCPSSSQPEDIAIVSCSLQGPASASPRAHLCPSHTQSPSSLLPQASHLLLTLPGLLLSAAISLANSCSYSDSAHLLQGVFPDLSMKLKLPIPRSLPTCPSTPEATYASVKALSTALERLNCLSSFPSPAALA